MEGLVFKISDDSLINWAA